MEHQFNVGDTVRRIRFDNGRGAEVGQLATVVAVEDSFVIVHYEGFHPCRTNGEAWCIGFTELVKRRQVMPRLNGAQDRAVLAIFRAAPDSLTPSDVWTRTQWGGRRWPLTSVRARITKLTDAGVLVKEPNTKPGLYGKPEHLWRLATTNEGATA